MKRQTIIALGVAIILGLVAVFIANAYISGRERRIAAETPTMTRVAVASIPLAYGNEITADKVKFVAYPAASLPPGTYKTLAELLPEGKSRVALRPIHTSPPDGAGRRCSRRRRARRRRFLAPTPALA